MLNVGTCLYFVVCFVVLSAQSSSIRRAAAGNNIYCNVDVGRPSVEVPLHLSTVLSGVILWEDPCVVLPIRCAPVCANEDFGPQVCRSECLPEKQRRWTRDCAARDMFFDSNYYNRSESTTHEEMQGEWTAQVGDFWKAEGGFLLDRLRFHDNMTGIRDGDNTPAVFAVENAQLMVGKVVNYYTLDNGISGYLGLAPGEHNIVFQAFNQGLIPAPIVASAPIDYDQQMLYFGGLPSDVPCANWSRFSTFENKWMFRADKMDVFGLTYANPIIHFTNEAVGYDQVLLSDEIIQRALRAGALVVDTEHENHYRASCSGDLTARMTVDDQAFSFPVPSVWDVGSTCYLYIGRISFFGVWNHGIAYTNTPTVIFYLKPSDNICLLYDYANQTISFANYVTD